MLRGSNLIQYLHGQLGINANALAPLNEHQRVTEIRSQATKLPVRAIIDRRHGAVHLFTQPEVSQESPVPHMRELRFAIDDVSFLFIDGDTDSQVSSLSIFQPWPPTARVAGWRIAIFSPVTAHENSILRDAL
jgi:hypothetical protein